MSRTVIIIPDKLNKEFRSKVALKYGGKKGALGLAVGEAIELWIKANK